MHDELALGLEDSDPLAERLKAGQRPVGAHQVAGRQLLPLRMDFVSVLDCCACKPLEAIEAIEAIEAGPALAPSV